MQAIIRRPVCALRRLYCSVADVMVKNCIVPDIFNCPPEELANIIYPPCDTEVELGKELTPTETQCEPSCVKWPADEAGFYTITMTDPDAPCRKDPKHKEWVHWLVGNIPGTNVEKGEVLAEYIGPGPPKDTGLHRYVFLIFKQRGKVKFYGTRLKNNSADGRPGFRVREFADRYDLGTPVAGNFFQAQYDDYVDELYEKLGVKTEEKADTKE